MLDQRFTHLENLMTTDKSTTTDWELVGKLIMANDVSRSLGNLTGTSNWASLMAKTATDHFLKINTQAQPMPDEMVAKMFDLFSNHPRSTEFSNFNWFVAGVTFAEENHQVTRPNKE